MKKRIISMLLGCFLVLGLFPVLADEPMQSAENFIKEDVVTGTLTLSGTLPEASYNRIVTVDVRAQGGAEAAYATVLETDAAGAFGPVQFQLADVYLSGDYVLTLGAYDLDKPFQGTFYYVNPEESETLYQTVSTMTDAKALQDLLTPGNQRILGISNAYFDTLPIEVCNKLVAPGAYTDLAGLQAVALSEIAVQALRSEVETAADVKTVLTEYAAYLALDGERMYEAYTELAQDAKKEESILTAYLNTHCTSMEEVRQLFNEAVVLELLAATTSHEAVTQLLSDYADILGINLSASPYADLKEPGQVSVALTGRHFISRQAFVDAFNDAVSDQYDNEHQPTGNTGGGSGSGSGSGSGRPSGSIQVIDPTPPPVSPSTPDPEERFTDIADITWAKDAIERLAEQNVVSGDGDGSFRPNDGVKREEFVKIVVTAFGMTQGGEALSFVDVSEGDWFYPYLQAAVSAGIVSGYPDGRFGKGEAISRQDMAVMLCRAAEAMSKTLAQTEDAAAFVDADQIASYAADSVTALQRAGVLNGDADGAFRPADGATRAEMCVMVDQLLTGGLES